jgi:hypothetical protein
MYQTVLKKLSRFVVTRSVFFLPRERRIAIERRHRGREQYGKLRRADCTIVSFGKSGRTWLRVMLSRVYQLKHGLSTGSLLSFDNLHRKNRDIPIVFFTHDNYVRDYTRSADVKSDYGDRKVVLLVRHPADVTVSQFFQWKHRMKPSKIDLLEFPGRSGDVELFDFVMDPKSGLGRAVDFLNLWARDIPELENCLLIRYEDLRADPGGTLASVLAFMGTPATSEQIRDAVEFGSVENMRKMEQKGSFWLSGGRLKPTDRANPDSYKVRRAKVGGYRDYFDDRQVAEIEALLASRLSPIYGYTAPPGDCGPRAIAGKSADATTGPTALPEVS